MLTFTLSEKYRSYRHFPKKTGHKAPFSINDQINPHGNADQISLFSVIDKLVLIRPAVELPYLGAYLL